ncbi:NrsF family protein [Bradyrhizobium sp. USDA 4353]
MDTDQLIRTLAADNAQRALPVGIVLALALMAATPVSTAMLLIGLGIRPDIWLAVRNPFFDLKFVVTTALAIPALIISVHLSRPEASLHGWGWLLIAPIVVLIGGIAAEMMLPQRAPMMARLVGHNSMLCVCAIPALSLPMLAAALFGLRHGAPSRPGVAGGIAGLVSAGIAATLYAAHCTDDSPLFVATWYTLAALAMAGLGALIGRRVLRY